LSAITAAVVGVILNLGLFFGWHVFWPEASADAIFSGRFEWAQALIAVAAFIALWRFRLGVMTVLGASALLGLAITYAA
jgi:chromate transporter